MPQYEIDTLCAAQLTIVMDEEALVTYGPFPNVGALMDFMDDCWDAIERFQDDFMVDIGGDTSVSAYAARLRLQYKLRDVHKHLP